MLQRDRPIRFSPSTRVLNGVQNFFSKRHPFLFAAADSVEFIFKFRGEIVIDILGEVAGQELGHCAADIGRAEAAAVERHILAPEQGLDDAGVGRRPADAIFLQSLDQTGFGITRRRLGEMLVGEDISQRHGFADLHRRQLARLVVVLGILLVAAFLVNGEKTRVDYGRAAGTERGVVAGIRDRPTPCSRSRTASGSQWRVSRSGRRACVDRRLETPRRWLACARRTSAGSLRALPVHSWIWSGTNSGFPAEPSRQSHAR